MEKIKNFLKNKSVGYYLVCANVILALVLSIIFLATYKGAMANNAASQVPETIAIYALAGLVVECVVLALPQYRFIHIVALFLFGLSLYKEVLLIPNLIADFVNNVFYQGGDLGTNVVYISIQFIIIIAGVVAAFLGFYKNEDDANADFAPKGTVKIATTGAGAVLTVAAVLVSTLVGASMERKAAIGGGKIDDDTPVEAFNPINDEIKAIADAYEYNFDPSTVLIKEQASYNFSAAELNSLSVGTTREGHNLVYLFEGSYAEGYQGDYSETYANIYLWDDGLMIGKAKDTTFKGYWYNSSMDADGSATVVDEETGEESVVDVANCLNMVSNASNYESIITEEAGGFYERQAYIYLNMGWGNRSIIVSGYRYYPEVALAIDATEGKTTFKVGDKFNRDPWVAVRVLKDLNYSAVFKQSEVKWSMNTGATLDTAGEIEVTATWNGLTAKTTITVEE